MVSKFTIFTSILLAFTGLADPSPLEEHIPRRRASHRSQLTSRGNIVANENWAGIELQSNTTAIFTGVTGTFTVPVVQGHAGTGVSFWVGFDESSCSDFLQAGVSASVGSDGQTVSYSAWYNWDPYSDGPIPFSDAYINPGDVITVSINVASNKKSGYVGIWDRTTGVSVGQEIYVSDYFSLCGLTAEWMVESYPESSSGGSESRLANFGTVTFTNARAYNFNGTYPASGGGSTDVASVIFVMDQSGQDVTYSAVAGDTVLIQYIGQY